MKIEVKDNNYFIDIDYKSDSKLKKFLTENKDSKYLVITDEKVYYIYKDRINEVMRGLKYFIFKFIQVKILNL